MPQWMRHYDALIYHARTGADVTLGRRHGPPDQVVIPNGADSSEFWGALPRFRARYDIRSRHMLLHVGNHYRVKNHRDLFRAVHLLRDLDVTLVMIGEEGGGDGGCWSSCAAMAAQESRVRVLRGLARADVAAAYRESEVFLLTSSFEAAPVVLVEAMAAGIPFVSYAVGNAADLTGGIVVGTVEEMVQAVRRLLQDGDGRHALGRAGREMQQGALEWDHIVDAYQALYVRLAERRRAR
jgi:glycosyltransferase involved in cell wall biosynthesis